MNPHGLHDPEHYTTAYDVYLMASAAMENETFRTIVRSPSHTLPATNLQPERTIYSSNGLCRRGAGRSTAGPAPSGSLRP